MVSAETSVEIEKDFLLRMWILLRSKRLGEAIIAGIWVQSMTGAGTLVATTPGSSFLVSGLSKYRKIKILCSA
jgi:hypothetical protein